MICGRDQEILYIVLPYFNHSGFQRRRELFVQFVRRMKNVPCIKIVVSECVGPTPLPSMSGVFRHFKFQTNTTTWLKENLVNCAVRKLQADWKYMAWIDADISFLNKHWVKETLDQLQKSDIVQMFQTVINLGSNGECIKMDKSFAYMFKDSGTPLVKNDRYGFWHPGYAWACTHKAWKRIGGLLDWAILGSGDRHMAYSFVGQVLDSAPGNIHPNYRSMLCEYQIACKGLSIDYVRGTILHHWHGSIKNRRYRERWIILTNHKYDPILDVGFQKSTGIIVLTEAGKRMTKDLEEYFTSRQEDDV